MNYNFINGKFIIAKLYDEFNIKSSDWESRAPRWIADALSNLKVFKSMKQVNKPIPIIDNIFKLPCNVKVLRSISVDGIKLDRVLNPTYTTTNRLVTNPSNTYFISGDEIHVEYKTGIAVVTFMELPVEWDDEFNMWIPLVPNTFQVIDNVTWYVLKLILARGYIHPLYSLTTNNPLLNPSLLWRDTVKGARLSINSMDSEERKIMSNVLSNFLTNPRADSQELFSIYANSYPKNNEPVVTFNDLLKE